MSITSPNMPLGSIDAVVFDSETTGLDARKARMIQLGAVAISAGIIEQTRVFEELINPGQKIPPETIAVHGITDDLVAGKPAFKTVNMAFQAFVDDRLLIGHSIAYDFAVLKEEYRLAGLDWKLPRSLDVRTLARLAAPGLADHSLDRICEWLNVSIVGRHTALGDARATAEAFQRLVPLLRERGVRTLAEAEAACRELAELDARAAGGLIATEVAPPTVPSALSKLDVFAFRHRVHDVMTAPPAILQGTLPIRDGIKHLLDAGLSSVFIDLGAEGFGIVTERDALRAVAAQAAGGLEMPLSSIAKRPLHDVMEHDHVYRAIGRMERLGIRHLAVRSSTGDLVGALTPRNLLRNRATTVIAIGDRIAAAKSARELGACWAEIPAMVVNLLAEGVDARSIAGIISSEICGITKRAAELAENEMTGSGKSSAPAAYAVLVLGSAGRGESLLAADQDNAIIYDDGAAGGSEDKWLEEMATHMARILDEVGIVYCKGGVMAKSRLWRHSRDDWTALVDHWVRRQSPQDLLNVDIFFDAVPVHGKASLGLELISNASATARRHPDFLKMMTELGRQWHSPVGMLGGFQKVDGRLDLKKFGLMPIFTAARILALRHGVDARSSADRLQGVLDLKIGSPEAIGRVLDAHDFLLRLVLEQQIEDGRNGVPLSPRIDLNLVSKERKRRLKDSFDAVAEVIDLVSEGRLQ